MLGLLRGPQVVDVCRVADQSIEQDVGENGLRFA